MNNAYRDFMKRQCLSEQAKQTFYNQLQSVEQRRPRQFLLKAAAVAACIVLMVPATVFAIDAVFHVGIVEFISGNTTGKFDTGFEIHYPEVSSRPLSDFSKDVQTADGYIRTVYPSWQEAEEALGIALVNNTILQGKDALKTHAYIIKNGGISERVHCYGVYEGKNEQLYRATLTAAYRYRGMHITLRATVTCKHPEISQDAESQLHWSGMLYENGDIAEMSQEAYVGSNGIMATIITVTKNPNYATEYRACFAANGASYNITVRGQSEKAKMVLTDIIEAFNF